MGRCSLHQVIRVCEHFQSTHIVLKNRSFRVLRVFFLEFSHSCVQFVVMTLRPLHWSLPGLFVFVTTDSSLKDILRFIFIKKSLCIEFTPLRSFFKFFVGIANNNTVKQHHVFSCAFF